jgi:hypothetical protein
MIRRMRTRLGAKRSSASSQSRFCRRGLLNPPWRAVRGIHERVFKLVRGRIHGRDDLDGDEAVSIVVRAVFAAHETL